VYLIGLSVYLWFQQTLNCYTDYNCHRHARSRPVNSAADCPSLCGCSQVSVRRREGAVPRGRRQPAGTRLEPSTVDERSNCTAEQPMCDEIESRSPSRETRCTRSATGISSKRNRRDSHVSFQMLFGPGLNFIQKLL